MALDPPVEVDVFPDVEGGDVGDGLNQGGRYAFGHR
jgi:hypothetical protein